MKILFIGFILTVQIMLLTSLLPVSAQIKPTATTIPSSCSVEAGGKLITGFNGDQVCESTIFPSSPNEKAYMKCVRGLVLCEWEFTDCPSDTLCVQTSSSSPSTISCKSVPTCGNGRLDPGEVCDPPGSSSFQCPFLAYPRCSEDCKRCLPHATGFHNPLMQKEGEKLISLKMLFN